MHIKKLVVTQDRRVIALNDLNRTLHLQNGAVAREKLCEGKNGVVESSTGEKLLVCDPLFKDGVLKLKRNAALIIPKDLGFIIADTGLNKNSIVIEAGSGSGGATIPFAGICKRVYSYDIRSDHAKLVRKNVELMELDNVTVETKDILEVDEFPEKADLLLLDLPNVAGTVKVAKKAVKVGGYIACYMPQISQVQDLVDSLEEDFKYEVTIELIQRRWDVNDGKLRPQHSMLGHTAFLTLLRYFGRW